VIIFVQNDPFVPAGNYAGYLAGSGVPYSVVRADQRETINLDKAVKGVIVLGGAMGVHDEDRHPFLVSIKNIVSQSVNNCTPFLGICLGGQLLAEVLGAKVNSGCCEEKGALSVQLTVEGRKDPLFEGLPEVFPTLQWHNDSFELPHGAVHLASSQVCPYQAFRYGHAWGVQFHPEVNPEIITDWCREIPGDPPMSEDKADELIYGFKLLKNEYDRVSHKILMNFIAYADLMALP